MISIEIVVFFACFAFFLSNPIFHQLLFSNLCKNIYNISIVEECYKNNTINQSIQKESSNWLLWINIFQMIPMTLVTLHINYAATRFSPEKLLFLPFLSFLIKMILGVFLYFCPTLSLSIYAPLSCVCSIFGGMGAFLNLITLYATYTTTPKHRSIKFIAIEAITVFSKFSGGLLSGYMIKYFSFLIPQLVSIGVVTITLFLSILLKRALPKNKTQSIDFSNLKMAFQETGKTIRMSKTVYLLITLTQIALPFGEVSTQKLVFLYSMNSKFEFTPTLGGYLLAVYSLTRAFGSLVILPILMRYFRVSEWKLCMAIIPIQSGFYLANAFATNRNELFIAPFFLTLQGIYSSVFISTISKMFCGQAQALILAIQMIISYLAASSGEILIFYIYRITIDTFPGMVFLIFGSVSIIATIMGTVAIYLSENSRQKDVLLEKLINNQDDEIQSEKL